MLRIVGDGVAGVGSGTGDGGVWWGRDAGTPGTVGEVGTEEEAGTDNGG